MLPTGSIVIVTCNSAEHIEACLRSVESSGWERIVVDNASRHGTVACACGAPGVRVLANADNQGFAAAANQGIRAAAGELVLLLNPDVVAEPGAVEALASALAHDGIAAAGGRLLDADGATQIGFVVRRFPTLARTLAEVLLLNRVLPENPWNRAYRCFDFDHDRPGEVEQPPGACLLLKRAVWEELGGLDEQFFPLWFEDVDFCRRLRARGGRIVYEPRARFRHAGGHSVAALAPVDRQLHWYRNLLRYFRKHHSPAAVGVLRTGILAGMLLRILAGLVGAAPDPAAAYAAVIRECVFGRASSAARKPKA